MAERMPIADFVADPSGGRAYRLARGAVLAAAVVLAPTGGRAFGVPGCINLPAYNRALGALQGMTGPCGMSVEEARRVVAEHDGVPAARPDAAVGGLQAAPGERLTAPKARVRHRRRPVLRVRG